MSESTYISHQNHNIQNQATKVIIMKNWKKMRKTHTFFLKIGGWNDAKKEVFESDMVSLREGWFEGKIEMI